MKLIEIFNLECFIDIPFYVKEQVIRTYSYNLVRLSC